jgi:RNA polymerase sigma-70 factor (ECF subfamily)
MDQSEKMGDETRAFLERNFPRAYLDELKTMAHALAGRKAGQVDPSGLVIDAILRAARHHRQLRDLGNLRAWVRAILVREIMSKLQMERYRRTREIDADYLHHLPERREPMSPLDREEEKSRAKAFLAQLLERLSEADREVICLSRLEGLPDPDAAELLGVSEEALRQRRCRAVKRLQQLARQSSL